MKKKLMSAIALTMVMALTFGMTAFAAESPRPEGANSVVAEDVAANVVEPTDAAEKEALDKEASDELSGIKAIDTEDATITALTAGELKNAKEVAAQVAVAAKGEGATFDILAAADIEIANFDGSFTINVAKVLDPAKIAVLHLNNGVWEVLDVKIENNMLTIYASSLSPIVVVEVAEKAGETTTTPTNNSGTSSTAATPAPAVSPKTGETVPVAGILAVICVAGAVVCAKRVRYNK